MRELEDRLEMQLRPMRRWRVHVDLTGSDLGALWLSCDPVLRCGWLPKRIREEAARHYGVPIEQVGEPVLLP